MAQVTDFPETVSAKTADGAQQWKRLDELIARRNVGRSPLANEVLRIDPHTAVLRRQVSSDRPTPDEDALAVYRLGKNGPIGVPTGLVFVRAASGNLQELAEQFSRIDFAIDKTAATPDSGWLRHQSGSAGKSLVGCVALQRLSELLVVEPQFLMARQAKTSRNLMRRR